MSWRTDPITPRQRVAIRLIEQYLGVQYAGGPTKGAASGFIGEYYERAKHVRDNQGVQEMTNRQAVVSLRQLNLLEEVGPWEEVR
jgi:hypothetical protein